VSFSEKLNELFGGQISGINNLNQQTAQSMQDAIGRLGTLVENIEASGRRSSDTMTERLTGVIEEMRSRQEEMNSRAADFVEQTRQAMLTSRSETDRKLEESLEKIGTQTAALVNSLKDVHLSAVEETQAREQALTSHVETVTAGLSGTMAKAIQEMGALSAQMTDSISKLSQTTQSSVAKLESGSERLLTAARDFAAAGDKVNGVMHQVGNTASKMVQASEKLQSAGSMVQELLDDYQAQRSATEAVLGELRATVEAARREASLTSGILHGIETSAQRLGAAQKDADEYLEGVSEVLGAAHQAFSDAVHQTLDKANQSFHDKLTQAVGLLSASITELEITLSSSSDTKSTNSPR
jgi:hypothetical protein